MGYCLFRAGRSFSSGLCVGLAAALKIYPAVAAAVLVAGLIGVLLSERRAWRMATRMGTGMILVPIAAALIFFDDTTGYVRFTLPMFASQLPKISFFSHSVPSTFHSMPLGAVAASGVLIVAWAAAALSALPRAPGEVFAGALAISTFIAATSYDYNLITAYPLLLVLLVRALAARGRSVGPQVALFVWGIVLVLLHRGPLEALPRARVILQLVWLLVVAAFVARDPASSERRVVQE